MITRELEPLGVEVSDVDLAAPGPDDVAALERLVGTHGVVVLPDQPIDDTAFTALLGRFGDLVFTAGETPVEGHPDLNVISNVGRTTAPRSSFHTDSSYFAAPPLITALRAVRIPEQGGETMFADQYAAWDSLDDVEPGLRERVRGLVVRHEVTGIDPADLDDDAERAAWHPLVQRHPVSDRETLYLSTPQRCTAIDGLADDVARDLLARILAHCTRPDNVLRHRWRPGDVVLWDNRCTLHAADHSGVVGDRVMHRAMVVAARA